MQKKIHFDHVTEENIKKGTTETGYKFLITHR